MGGGLFCTLNATLDVWSSPASGGEGAGGGGEPILHAERYSRRVVLAAGPLQHTRDAHPQPALLASRPSWTLAAGVAAADAAAAARCGRRTAAFRPAAAFHRRRLCPAASSPTSVFTPPRPAAKIQSIVLPVTSQLYLAGKFLTIVYDRDHPLGSRPGRRPRWMRFAELETNKSLLPASGRECAGRG